MKKNDLKRAQSRAVLYRMMALPFREPYPEKILSEQWQMVLEELPGIESESIPIPPNPEKNLELEMREVFGHNLSPDCPPYETQYGKLDVFRSTQILADLAGFYRAFGLDMADHNRRPDHIATELEFVSLLCLKESMALENNDQEHADLCRAAERRFLATHLGRWVGSFVEAISRKAPGSYYTGLSQTLHALVSWDQKKLGVNPDSSEFYPIRMEEPEEDCSSCFGGVQ